MPCYTGLVDPQVRASQGAYLWPLGVQEACLDGVIEGLVVLLRLHVRCRAVAVQDAVLRIDGQSFTVEHNGLVEVALVAGLVALAHLLNKLSLAQHGAIRASALKALQPKQRNLQIDREEEEEAFIQFIS